MAGLDWTVFLKIYFFVDVIICIAEIANRLLDKSANATEENTYFSLWLIFHRFFNSCSWLFHSFSILLMGSRERQEKTFYNPHEDRREYFQACLSATFSQKGPDRKHGIIQLWDFSILTEACTGTRGICAGLAFTHNLYANAELSRLFPPACPWAAHFGIIGSMLLLGCQNWIMMNRDQIILNCITTKPHISLKPRPAGQEDTVPPWVAPQN